MKKNVFTSLTAFAILFIGLNTPVIGQKMKINLDDLFKRYTFYEKSINGITSMNDGESYTVLEDNGKVIKYDYSSGKQVDILFDPSTIKNIDLSRFEEYSLSEDESKMMIITNVSRIYRHSFNASFYIFDLKTKNIEPLTEGNQVMLATFSPDGKKVSFVRDNNIFIKDLSTKEVKQVTTDGKYNSIINGAPDWVYEEEFSLLTGMQWSPDSKKIAFLRFDESDVKQFNMTKYQGSLYPENYTFKYPKAGEKNSVVSVNVFNLEQNSTIKMDVGTETDQYIARIKWPCNSNQISIIKLNRLQNKMDVLLSDANTGESKVLYHEENKYYLPEPTDNLITFTDDGKSFIITSEKSGYNQIYLYGMDGKLIKQLTQGINEVIEIFGYNQKEKRIYYKAYDQGPSRNAIIA